MSYINEYKTILSDAEQGKKTPQIQLEFFKMYFLAAIADELHTLNITSKDIRNELKKRK